ncbi:MAG: DUF3352 domain-containing protein [Candidatus Limnocylindria bacterium]
MRRLVVASTTLLVVVGAVVVASYLLLFSAVQDRASRAAPGDTALYVNVYLQPSSGQQLNLFGLIGHLRGFGDPAALEEKIDEVAGRLLGQAGIDYATNVRPWLGGQIAIAAAHENGVATPGIVLLVAVKDSAAATVAVPRLFSSTHETFARETYRGQATRTSEGLSYALLDDLLVVASTPERLRAALDANADRAPSLADRPEFSSAMRGLASDHLASLYLDLPRAIGLTGVGQVGGYGTAALAITADADGLHLDGTAPFAADATTDRARSAFALGRKASTLAGWMPREAGVEAVIFGAAQSFLDLEATLGADQAFAPAADALNQLRTIATIGLGVNLDRDLLPLLDGEGAVALQGLDAGGPHGQILLRPTDPEAAHRALDRMRTALADRGSQVSSRDAAGTPVTSVTVPGIGTVAYAEQDGVVLVGLHAADVAAAVEAHARGEVLAGDDRYRVPFELAGARAGDELWADVPSLVDGLAGIFDPGSELRDILHQIGELAISAAAGDDRLEIHGVLTVK